MNYLTIENKSAKVKLNDHVDKFSVDKVIEDIEKVYGMKAVNENYAFGEITACAENAVDTLEIEIHSGGGSVFEGNRIYNELKKLRARGVFVTARVNTLAASMGSVIAMGADKVEIANNGKIMIHEASGGAHGNAEELARYAALLDEISDDIAGIYSEKTGKSKDEMRTLMKKETWMSAKDAVKMGFADEIFDTKSNSMGSILDKFRPDAALVEKVQGLEASLKDSETQIEEITAALTERTGDLEKAIAEISEVTNKFSELQAQVATITAERDGYFTDMAELSLKNGVLEAAVKTAEESANAKALEIAAQAGLAPLNVDANEKGNSNEMSRSDFNNLNAKQRMAFAKNKGKITN